MSFDLTRLLEQWEYEPGQVMVRRFMGKDGKEKIQLRLDLGILQMNAEGRPDGKRPLGHETYYDFLRHKLRQHQDKAGEEGGEFSIDGEDCSKLQLEALQFHHRYICLLQLEDFDQALRDATRNLEVFDFAEEYAETDEYAWALQQFRPQVLMLQTRAKAARLLEDKNYAQAVQEVEAGLCLIRQFFQEYDRADLEEQSAEIQSLENWLNDINAQRPLSKLERLERDLQKAIQIEDFEKAARVRDQIRALHPESNS